MKEPRNFSIFSDYLDILFITETAMAPLASINGVKIKTINVNFQEKLNANIKEVTIVAVFKQSTETIPVKKLSNW
jgi:hypothetical protein